MKILYITLGCFDKGGISRYCRYQVEALRDIVGVDNIRVLSVRGPDANAFETAFDVTFYAGTFGLKSKMKFVLEAVRQTIVWQPDIIWSAHINLSGLAAILKTACSGKVVQNIYGGEVWSPKSIDAAWGLRNADFIVSDCYFTARYVTTERLVRGDIEVVWDCVDVDRFYPRRPNLDILIKYNIPDPDSGINLMTLGRMVPEASYKGYERLFDVFANVSSSAPMLRVVFCGQGQLTDVIRRKAAEAQLADRVFFTGAIHEDDLSDVYCAGHIFSLVSDRGERRGEGVPLVLLEAAASGMPILAGNQDGSQEAVVDGVNGFIVDPFDRDRHADIILSLVKDDVKRKEIGKNGVQCVHQKFSYEIFRDKHRELLGKWF